MEGTIHEGHEDHIAGKGMSSLNHNNLVHKYILIPQAMKIPEANAAVEKRMEKLGKMSARQLTKVRNKREVIDEARKEGKTVHFCVIDGHLSSEEFLVGTIISKIQRPSCTPRWVKDDSGSNAVFTEQGSSASEMTATKVMDVMARLPGCAGQAAVAVSAYTQVKMEDDYWMSRHLDSSTTTQMA